MPKKRVKSDEDRDISVAKAPNNNYEILEKFVDAFQKEYNLDLSKVVERVKKEAKSAQDESIPTGAFNSTLSSFETICKYLHENRGYTYSRTARILGRNARTIWTTYQKALKKYPKSLKIRAGKTSIPLQILTDRNLSVLESIVVYLKKEGLRFSEISAILKRDERNVWTVHNRAMKKWGNK